MSSISATWNEIQRLNAELSDLTSQHNFYERIPREDLPFCPADNSVILDLDRAYEGPDGVMYHSRDCAGEHEIMNSFCKLDGEDA